MKKAIEYIFCTASALLLAWVFVSWVDIVLHNLSTCQYLAWNFFVVFF